MDFGHWVVSENFNSQDFFGFVYRIVDKDTGQEYIGKKQFHAKTRKPPLKGKKRVRLGTKESDWRSYTSSSAHLNEQITARGKDRFEFFVISLHKTKAGLHYAEVETQVAEDVLRAKLPDGTKKYYNRAIGNIKFIPPDEVSEETRYKMSENARKFWSNMTAEQRQDWISKHLEGDNNPMYGRTGSLSPRFGADPWEKLTEERKSEIRKAASERNSGEGNPRFGKSPFEHFTTDQMELKRAILSEMMSGAGNPMHGRPCYYKMTDDEKEDWKANISKATSGKKKSEETKARMRKPKPPAEERTCPHCGKIGTRGNMTRYHFDNCKSLT